MKIRLKLTLGILIVGLLGSVLGTAATIKLQLDSVEATASREAETVATMLVHLLHHEMSDHGDVTLAAAQAELQKFVEAFYAMHQNDIVIVDTDKQIIADAIPQNVGTRFQYDPGSEVARTLQDGVTRTFVETSADYPQGIQQVVVPFTTADGKTIGAVIFDYTPLYQDLAASARTTAGLIGLVALLSTLLAVGVGYLVARSISKPLDALTQGAARIAAGDMNVRVQVNSNDELGDLAASFNRMTEELKGSYEALQQAEEKYRSIFENAVVGIYQTTPEGHYRMANPTLARILGYESPEALLQTVTDLNRQFYVQPERRAEFIQRMEEHDAVREFESEVYCKDGRVIWISENARAIRDAGGRIAGFEGTTLDITARKQAEEAFHRLNEEKERILNSAGEGIFGVDLEGRTTFVNPAAARMSGWEAEELIGQLMHDLLHHSKPDGTPYPREECPIYAAFKNGVVHYVTDEVFWRKDGASFPVEYVSTPIRDRGRLVGAVVTFTDITERKRTGQVLRESETRFKSLFEDSPISLWEEDFSLVAAYLDELRHSGVTDFRAWFENHPEAVAHCATMVKVIDVNKGTLKLYKAKTKEDLLTSLNAVFSEESIPTFGEELIALAEGKTKFESEIINQDLAGAKIPVAFSWSVAPSDEKVSLRLFVSISDITARKWAEEKLAAKVMELEQHNREINLLNEMGDLLQTCHIVEEASAVVAQFARQLFPHQSGALCLIAPSRNLVDAITTWGEFPLQDRIFTPDDCWALRRGQTHCVTDPGSGLLCRHVSPSFDGAQDVPLPASYLCVPMMAQGETLGILHLRSGGPVASQTREEQAAVMASQQQLAVTLAEQIALALANLKLREALRSQAIRDPLTGLFNRRYMEETLERELRRAERRKVPLGVIMFDLDHFKKFNDTFGHPAGDVVLREIGAFLQTRVRVEDIACRYGGEEFLVILPEASLKDTLKRARQLREGIKQLHVRYHDQALGAVTVSLGVAVFPDHGSTTEAILRVADAALYRAKQEGRDRVVTAEGS